MLDQQRKYPDLYRGPTVESASARVSLNDHFACVGELDGVSDEVEQDLRQAAFVASARGQIRLDLGLEGELLVGASGSTAL